MYNGLLVLVQNDPPKAEFGHIVAKVSMEQEEDVAGLSIINQPGAAFHLPETFTLPKPETLVTSRTPASPISHIVRVALHGHVGRHAHKITYFSMGYRMPKREVPELL